MELLDALLLLREKAVTGVVDYPNHGICSNLSRLTDSYDFPYYFVKDNCEDWQNFSGDTSYPIEGYDLGDLWEGRQLRLRLSLLDHLIAKAKLLQV